jgi:hypothetical protein
MIDSAAVLEHLDGEQPALVDLAIGYASRRAQLNPQFPFDHLGQFHERPVAQARLLQAVTDFTVAWAKTQELGDEVEHAYWSEFAIFGRGSFGLVDEASRGLLNHGRPAAALQVMQLYLHGDRHRPNPRYVTEGLEALGPTEADLGGLAPYEIETLIEYLRESEIDEDEVAVLEWKVLPALGHEPHGLFLERKLARDPAFFAEVLSLCFRPKASKEDPEVPQNVAANAYRLLRSWETLPGAAGRGEPVDLDALNAWYTTSERLLVQADRLDIGQQVIGQVLAHAPADEDGLWPCQPVRSFIEQVESEHIEKGFQIESFNMRGMVSWSLDEGGAQERALADRYSDWASRMTASAPRTAAVFRALAKGYRLDGLREDQEIQRQLEGFSE